MKTKVIYHSADFDGIFCREIAKQALQNQSLIAHDLNFIGWNHGDEKIPYNKEDITFILDLSPECLADYNGEVEENIFWIDHHKTAIEKFNPLLKGYRIDGVAACRLTWQWFNNKLDLPNKEAFVNREVDEPLSVQLAGEYDVWDKRNYQAELLQYALRSVELTEDVWKNLLTLHDDLVTCNFLHNGVISRFYAGKMDDNLMKKSFILKWEGLTWLTINTGSFNSLTFKLRDLPETGHDALLGFMFNGKNWMVSLYHARHRTDIDLSEIAKKYNGGGHRGACGFTCKQLPFEIYQ